MTETTTFTMTVEEERALLSLREGFERWRVALSVRSVAETARMGEQRTREALRGLQAKGLAYYSKGAYGRVRWRPTSTGGAVYLKRGAG